MSIEAIGAVAPQQTQAAQDVQSSYEMLGSIDYQPVQKPDFEPMETAEGARAISDEAIQKQLNNINELLKAKGTNVSMEYDGLSSPKTVSIVDNDTGKVIREMPARAAVEIAEKARAYIIGMLVDSRA